MWGKIIDGIFVTFDDEVIDTNNGVILPKATANLSYDNQWVSVVLGDKPVEYYIDCLYVVVLKEKLHQTHYRLVSVRDDKLTYRNEDLPWCGLKEALHWRWRFINDPELQSVRDNYELHRIMPYCDTTLDWVKSYMPRKRGAIDQATRRAVYAKCKGHCAYCGREIDYAEMQVDHVDSHYRHQGKDELDNYLPACRDCNGLKSDYLLEEFRNVLIPNCAKRGKICGNNRNSRICKAYGLLHNPKKKIVFYFEKEDKE